MSLTVTALAPEVDAATLGPLYWGQRVGDKQSPIPRQHGFPITPR